MKKPMPSYYGKNIAQHAQRKFLARWKAEHPQRGGRVLTVDGPASASRQGREEGKAE